MTALTQPSARITVTTGPDRGRLFELSDELVHIGRAADNEIILNDPTLHDRQASIVRRNGRHAIFVNQPDEVEVDGTPLPAERWVWLPETALIQLNRRTALEFISLLPPPDTATEEMTPTPERSRAMDRASASGVRPAVKNGGAPAPAVIEEPKGKRPAVKRAEARRPDKPAAKVARFITDRAGDPLVKLGEDGHFPELQLLEGQETKVVEVRKEGSNNLMLIAVFLFSVGLSALMLFVDIGPISGGGQRKALARQVLTFYYGEEGTPLLPYQIALREARQAYSQGDFALERRRYRDVLRMLRAENKNPLTGLTVIDRAAQQRFEQLTITELSVLGNDFWDLNSDDKLARLIGIVTE